MSPPRSIVDGQALAGATPTSRVAALGPTGTAVADQTVYRWRSSVGLHLLPGLLLFAGCLAFRPLVAAAGLPPGTGLTLAGILVVAPFQLLYLAHRSPGRSGGFVVAIAEAAGFRCRLPAGQLRSLVATLVAFAAVALVVLYPVTRLLDSLGLGSVPAWLSSGGGWGVLGGLSVLGGVLTAVAEELYYRGHLMARIPADPFTATVTGAALSASTHFWQPSLIPVVFVVQAMLGLTVRRTGSIRVAVYTHLAMSLIGTAFAAAALV